MQIRCTPEALEDFKDISAYIERERNLETANRICRTIYDAVQTLRKYSHIGRPGRRGETREMVIGHYVVIYRIHFEAVQILRIWHAAQDWHSA